MERRSRGRAVELDLPEGVDLDDPVGVGRFWHPSPGSAWEELDAWDTVKTRLQWRKALGREDEPFLCSTPSY
jgi:hypothetical protein